MPKLGFKNQWVAISQTGKVKDSEGVERDLSKDFLTKVVANFTPGESPVVIGHPKDNMPAFGWATALRLNGEVLEAQFADTDDSFEKMVEEGKFRKRSASFYLDPARLKHVGFLGAQPPAVKGLQDIKFSDGESVTVEISFSEDNETMKDEEVAKVADGLFDKLKNLFKTPEDKTLVAGGGNSTTAQFTETDVKTMIADAVKAATADFTEKLKPIEEASKALQDEVNRNSASGKRAEIISFVEAIPADKGKHFLKQIGVVEFLESCARADAADKEPAVICFSEGEGDKREEHKLTRLDWAKNFLTALPPMIEFGEKFGTIKATSAADEPVQNPATLDAMRAEMGIKKDEGGKK